MKRDMDLIRGMLLKLEELPPGQHVFAHDLVVEGHDEDVVTFHAKLLLDAGFVDGEIDAYLGGGNPSVLITEIRWMGHEFLDAARNDTVWNQAKSKAASIGGNLSLDVMKELLVATTKGLLGLS